MIPARIVVVGDSISAPGFDPTETRDHGWAELIKVDGQVNVVNLSVGGASAWTMAQQPAHWPIWYSVGAGYETYGLIALGTNDGFWQRTQIQFGLDVATIGGAMLTAGASKVILLKMPTATWAPHSHPFRVQYNTLLAATCAASDAFGCIDVSDMPLSYFPALSPWDHSPHPNAAGQAWLASAILDEILSWG